MKQLNYDHKIKKYNDKVKDSYIKSSACAFTSIISFAGKTFVKQEEISEFISRYINMSPGNLEVILCGALTAICLVSGVSSLWNTTKIFENSEARQKYVDSEINRLNKELEKEKMK